MLVKLIKRMEPFFLMGRYGYNCISRVSNQKLYGICLSVINIVKGKDIENHRLTGPWTSWYINPDKIRFEDGHQAGFSNQFEIIIAAK